MKKINNNLPRGGAEWGRALRRFLSDNIVPIMFVLICAYCIPRADLSWNYLLNEGMTRLGCNAFLIPRIRTLPQLCFNPALIPQDHKLRQCLI